MSTSREVDKLRSETTDGVNFGFVAVIEEEILQIITFLDENNSNKNSLVDCAVVLLFTGIKENNI